VCAAACSAPRAVDVLVVVGNNILSTSNGATLAANFPRLIDGLTSATPADGGVSSAPVTDLHVGVISGDLGTPGSVVPSCDNSDSGDDGQLNPIRNGAALASHLPWTTDAGVRPEHCTPDRNQYPTFLDFGALGSDPAALSRGFSCTAALGPRGCGIQQPLEAVYRALVLRDARQREGNTDTNAGFLRDDATLVILMFTDAEDGSVRDCRYAEPGVPCEDATSVYDITSPLWASTDLSLRLYLGEPGTATDPAWPIERYIDPARPHRGFTSLKPGAPDRVIFAAIAGVPILMPAIGSPPAIDWDTLLGRNPDGSDGYVATSAEGPISMRQANRDPGCANRVVPACRREGSAPTASCDASVQYFGRPGRRIAQVVRRFAEAYGTGILSSICALDYSRPLVEVANRVRRPLARF